MVSFKAYDRTQYQPVSAAQSESAFWAATLASAAIMSPFKYCGKPFETQLLQEQKNNHLYKDAFYRALEVSGLDKKGVSIVKAQNFVENNAYKLGTNACYDLNSKKVILNTNKISIAGFHELGHAMNSNLSKLGKFSKTFIPIGIFIASIMEYVSLAQSNQPKEEKGGFIHKIRDNAGKIAFLGFVPQLIEEAAASIKGINLAKKSGLDKALLPNLKKMYAKAFFTYFARAGLTGLAVGAANIIMQRMTRPKKIENNYFNY